MARAVHTPRRKQGMAMRLIQTCAVAIAATFAGVAYADDDTDSFVVSATVLATCDVAANDLEFGDYDPIVAAHLDAATTLSVTCTNGTAFNLGLDLGAGATPSVRLMADGANTLSYTLYRNPGRTLLWGQTIGSDTLAGAGSGSAATIDLYGRVPMHQTAPAGSYVDTITVRVTW